MESQDEESGAAHAQRRCRSGIQFTAATIKLVGLSRGSLVARANARAAFLRTQPKSLFALHHAWG